MALIYNTWNGDDWYNDRRIYRKAEYQLDYGGATYYTPNITITTGTTTSGTLGTYTPPPPREKTDMEWLREQVDEICKGAFA